MPHVDIILLLLCVFYPQTYGLQDQRQKEEAQDMQMESGEISVTSLPTTISIPSSNPAASTHGKLAALIGIFNRNCSNYATTITSEASGNASGYSSGSQQSQTDVNKFQGPIPPMQPAAFASVSGPNAGATARGFAGKVGVEPNVPIHNPGIPTDELAQITNGRVLKLEERLQLIEAKLREHGLL